MVPNIPRKEHCFEIVVLQLGFNYLFIKIYKELLEPPYQCYIIVFWNWEFDLYKEQILNVGKMTHEHETNNGTIFLSTKHKKIKPMEKMLIG